MPVNISRPTIIIFAVVLAIVAVGVATISLRQSADPRSDAASDKLDVVATTSMIADAAREIGGAQVTVKSLMGPGVDPHSYRTTRGDITAMVRADLVLYSGLDLEAQMVEFFEDLKKRKRVAAVGEAVPVAQRIPYAAHPGRYDPHIWMAPDVWRFAVEKVRDELIAARPRDADTFQANAANYLSRFSELKDYATRVLATVPAERRVILTAHDAFSYFGRDFGFEVIGIQGISTESEAGLNRIKSLVDTIVSRGITAVFIESSVAERNVRALIEGAAARGAKVEIGGELFSDAMGQPGTYEGTYIGMIDHNITVITRALGGAAPELGMSGALTPSADRGVGKS